MTPNWMGFVPIKNTASVNVAQLGSDIIALFEAQRAYHLDSNLGTVGPWKPRKASTPLKVNAHYRKYKTNISFSLTTPLFQKLYFMSLALLKN